MKSAIGNSLLLNIVIIIVSVVILVFVSIISYSKAYRVKNRIIEVIEKYGTYDSSDAKDEIESFLKQSGYVLGKCDSKTPNDATDEDTRGYKYCIETVYSDPATKKGSRYYKVTTYVEFNFPVIDSLLVIPVHGETKTLGINYSDYDN